jgi:glucosamine--fructose-6-phosphate aminotransferase (isomerizing)
MITKHQAIQHPITELDAQLHHSDKGGYRHYMLKEIYEQPQAIQRTLDGRIQANGIVQPHAFGTNALKFLPRLNIFKLLLVVRVIMQVMLRVIGLKVLQGYFV